MKGKVLLLSFMLMFAINSYGQSGQDGNILWSIEDSTLTISGTGAMKDYMIYTVVPWYSYRESVKYVIVEEGVTHVGDFSFYDHVDLLVAELSNSITSFGYAVFAECISLTGVEMPDNITSLGSNMFFGCSSLNNVIIPSNITNIANNAFGGCSNLISVEIPDHITSLGDCAFISCDNLISVKMPNGITSIGNNAFSGCSSLININLPKSLTSLGNSAFEYCKSLESIKIPHGIIQLEAYTFYSCSNLTSISIPSTVANLGNYALGGCSLTAVDVYWENDPVDYSRNTFQVFPDKVDQLSLLEGITLFVPYGTKSIYEELSSSWRRFGTIIERAPEVPVTSVSVSPKTASLMAGSSLQLVATISPSNATNQNVTWSSSNNAVATVDATGKVMAVGGGSATITVTTDDGGMTATFNVTVFEIAVTSVTLNTVAESIFIGDTLQLTATVNPSYASNKTVTWSSSNSAVAMVDATGKVTGMSEGSATITATSNNGKTATCMVTVSQLTNYVTIEIPIGDTGESIVFDIERSAGSNEVNSFVMGFPEGLDIDPGSVILTESLSEGLVLTVISLGYNTWLFEVSAPSTFSLRSAMSRSQTTPISYRITGSMANAYEIVLCDVNTALNSGTNIPKYELIPAISTMAGETANGQVEAGYVTAIIANGSLIIETPYNETVKVYSIAGTLVYAAEKTEGKVSYSVSNLPNGIYVVTGSNGWSVKVLKK